MAPALRIRRRRHERGAAVFVVVMVVTLLTAIGVFAIRSTSLVDQAAGHDRQAMQTAYLADYASRAVTAEIGDGAARTYLDKIGLGTDKCIVNTKLTGAELDPNLVGPVPCYKLFISEIERRTTANSSNTVLDAQTAVSADSLGPKTGAAGNAASIEGVFVVEMIEPAESVPTAGSAQGGNNPANAFRDVQLTLTSYAQVRPLDTSGVPDDPWCPIAASSTAASVSGLRSHVTLKNVPR